LWSALLVTTPALIIAALAFDLHLHPDIILVIGLCIFGTAFAANAAGRFGGTLLSGLIYQWGGLTACLAGSALMLATCFLVTLFLPLARDGDARA
jgi:hypothetical protein